MQNTFSILSSTGQCNLRRLFWSSVSDLIGEVVGVGRFNPLASLDIHGKAGCDHDRSIMFDIRDNRFVISMLTMFHRRLSLCMH